MKHIISVKDLTIKFENNCVFSNLNLKVVKGDKVAIIGESGSGKTTLINTLCGFNTNFKGEILIKGIPLNKENTAEIRKHISWLPQELTNNIQNTEDLFFYPFTFKANRHLYPSKNEIEKIFNEFGLSYQILQKKVQEISGGQKQRLVLASIILLKKDIIFLDEPTSALDEKNVEKVVNYLLQNKDLTIVATSHNKLWIDNSTKVLNIEDYARND